MRGKPIRTYQLALSGKKTIFHKKKPIVYFIRVSCIDPIEESNDFEKEVYLAKDVKKFDPCDYPLSGDKWLHSNLCGERAVEKIEPSKDGNVVLGFCTVSSLILDVDEQLKERVLEFADIYAEFQGLGSSLVTETSKSSQRDLLGNELANYCIVFGKPNMCWEEVSWHLSEARRLGMVKRVNAVFARFEYITERANSKNKNIPPPKILKFFPHGDMRKIRDYVQFLNRYKALG